jgi:hypothetical protein
LISRTFGILYDSPDLATIPLTGAPVLPASIAASAWTT